MALIAAGCSAQPVSSVSGVTATPSASPSSEPSEGTTDATGRLEAAIAGEAERTWDLELASWEEEPDGTVLLLYGSDSEAGLGENVSISFNASEFSIVTSGGSADVTGSSTETCVVEFDRQEPDSIAGTFECPDVTAVNSAEVVLGAVDFTGSFEAAR